MQDLEIDFTRMYVLNVKDTMNINDPCPLSMGLQTICIRVFFCLYTLCYDISTAGLLDTPINDQDVTTISSMYLTQWEELSPFLGLTKQHESEIKHTFKDYSDQKQEALHRWKRIKGRAATYRAFIAAATAIPNMDLVDNVKAMLQTREWSTGN